jgi:hypothetical protein
VQTNVPTLLSEVDDTSTGTVKSVLVAILNMLITGRKESWRNECKNELEC